MKGKMKMNNAEKEYNIQTFFTRSLIAVKGLLLNPEMFFKTFDNYINMYPLDDEQIKEIGSYRSKSEKELKKLLKKQISRFVAGDIAKLVDDPRLVMYAYQHQKSSFIEGIPDYLKQYGTKIPLHPEKDATLFGGDSSRITFIETLLALEHEGLIQVLRLELGLSEPHKRTMPTYNTATSLFATAQESSFVEYPVPVTTIQLTKKLIDLIEPNLAYMSPKLHFKGGQITISEGLQDSLCRVIFRNKKNMIKKWNWDEVLDKQIGMEKIYDAKKDWRKVYDPGRAINRNVAVETGVKDLLIVTKRTIRVNPKYLPSSNK